MRTDYTYCLNQDSCIHRRGCKRWIGNYSEQEAIEESNNNCIGYIDDEECIRDEDLEDKQGNWIPTAYGMLDRFRYSDGMEMKKWTREHAKSIFTIHSNGQDEYIKLSKRIFTNFIDRVYDNFEAKDKFRKCNNCKHKDGESGGLTHCSYFEQFMPTEIGKCDIWESKNA